MPRWYVYIDYRKDIGEVCYIGKGDDHRITTFKRNKHYNAIRNKHGISRKIAYSCDNECDALVIEKLLINLFSIVDNAKLCNKTEGGRGISGYRHLPESKEAIRRFQKQHKKPPFSAEHRMAISIALIGNDNSKGKRAPLSSTHRDNISKQSSGVPKNRKVFLFYHQSLGFRYCTQLDLKKEFPTLSSSNLSTVCSGKRAQCSGWQLWRKHE